MVTAMRLEERIVRPFLLLKFFVIAYYGEDSNDLKSSDRSFRQMSTLRPLQSCCKYYKKALKLLLSHVPLCGYFDHSAISITDSKPLFGLLGRCVKNATLYEILVPPSRTQSATKIWDLQLFSEVTL